MEEFLNPSEILKKLNLRKEMVACDFGCGSGGWVIPLAKILEDGQVFAIDILEEPLSALRSRAKLEKLSNIDAIKANVEKGVSLLSNSCDLVLMTNLLFQVRTTPDVDGETSGVKRVLEEGKRILKKGGRILLVDWKPGISLGPKEKVSMEEIIEIASELDFKLETKFNAGPYHYGLILVK